MDESLKRRQEPVLFSDWFATLQSDSPNSLRVQENRRSIRMAEYLLKGTRRYRLGSFVRKVKGYHLSSAKRGGWRAHLTISGSGQKGVVNASSADRSMIYRNEAAISLDAGRPSPVITGYATFRGEGAAFSLQDRVNLRP